ncbi:glycosyltransferase family 2 protein [Megalodesulfovibrio gigas]|uniref:Glycosyl transferase family 2 n=1 Tax=Megalodesulfovibrio gigas (strain ATCC 19364 / DSM 1382 / NCIMB 9332 / VKM B-1759) TaxID=1121448 RepID=T2GFE9_MEGG1|nr:glycosyltransferase family 2 protein [Megalodesulfovibrio gigas]AGW15018.1 hypothetical protein DGI_3324 [Megalodesulfovibrio gigas DSM 1382 = ATCC 19364]
MKLVAQVIAGNSAHDLIGCFAHHRSMGVDAFIVCHWHSDDNTPELLQTLEREHADITVVQLPGNLEQILDAERATLDLARRKYDADWIIRIDSDERWLVQRGSLKEAVAKETQTASITAPRYNIVWPTPEAAAQADISSTMALRELPLAVFPVTIDPAERSTLGGIPWVLTRVGPKCCMRACESLDFNVGGHAVINRVNKQGIPTSVATDIVIAHIAFTTLARFEIKMRAVSMIVDAAPANRNPNLGWHWVRLAEIFKQGPAAVEAEWRRQFMTPEAAEQLVGREVVVPGDRVFELARTLA